MQCPVIVANGTGDVLEVEYHAGSLREEVGLLPSGQRASFEVPCSFETVRGACQATILAIQTGIPVARIELLNAEQVRACNSYSKLSLPETPLLLLEFHGSEAEVAEQSKNFGAIARECGGGDFSWKGPSRCGKSAKGEAVNRERV